MSTAITVSNNSDSELGGDTNLHLYLGTLALPTSWTAAGVAVAITGCERIARLWITGGSGAANRYAFEWDKANQKLLAFRSDQVDDPQEAVPDATDLSALTALDYVAIGQ